MTGKTILHYRIGDRLGAGGMGEVYLAEDTRLRRQVAVKFLPASYQYDIERRDRFFREASTASSLRSPYTAAIYDIGEHEGSSFIVMEYVEGEPLSSLLGRGPLPVSEAVDIAMQVADALDEAHSLGIVHRDVKSANLMVTGRGLVKVLDFGVARVTPAPGNGAASEDGNGAPTARLGQETVTGLVMGTVSYMSPEQALGREIDGRSDLFSLGVVAYEMLTSRLPFDGNSLTEIIDRIVHEEPPAIARFNYSVPQELERIIRKSLEKNTTDRYQTARDLYIDLRNLRRDLEAKDRAPATNRPTTEHNLTVTLDAPVSPSGTITVAPLLENAVAVMTFQNITKEAADDWIGSGIAETVTADLKKVRGISVIGRERVFEVLKNIGSGQLNESDDSLVIEIGRRSGAAWIIAGGYQRIADLIRITARVVTVATGGLLKSVKIDGKISDIFDLQDKIVLDLSRGLNVQLDSGQISEIAQRETVSVEAYENFSRGVMNLRTGSRNSLDRAIHLFEKAIEVDPDYAAAHALLGAALNLKGDFLTIPELHNRAMDEARKAISLNANLSYGHHSLGSTLSSLGRYDEAIDAFKQAIRIEPNNAGAHSSLGRVYWLGKGMIPEGIEEHEQAIKLNPEAGYAFLQLANLHIVNGNYQRAEELARKAVDLQERYISGREGLQVVGAHTKLGYVYYRQQRYDESIREYERELDFLLSSDHALRDRHLIELDQKLGAAYLRKNMNVASERHFKRGIKKFEERLARGADDPFTKYYVACLYALQGDNERALKLFEETLEHVREFNIIRGRTDPDLENLRDNPRFRELVGLG
jgi:serine/threonine protein kinase/tetratricopeptide (TPR) repeat protein